MQQRKKDLLKDFGLITLLMAALVGLKLADWRYNFTAPWAETVYNFLLRK